MAQNKEWTYRGWDLNDIQSMKERISDLNLEVDITSYLENTTIGWFAGSRIMYPFFYKKSVQYSLDSQTDKSIEGEDSKGRDWDDTRDTPLTITPLAITSAGLDTEGKHLLYSFYVEYFYEGDYDFELRCAEVVTINHTKLEIGRKVIPKQSGDSGNDCLSEPRVVWSELATYLQPIRTILHETCLPVFWKSGPIPAWHRTKKQQWSYMGFHSSIDPDELELSKRELDSLMQSDVGGTASILLAYSALALMRPLIKNYGPYTKKETMVQAKTQLDKQITLSLLSDADDDQDRFALQKLAHLCCGVDKSTTLSPAGVQVPKLCYQRKCHISPKLHESMLEGNNGVLWIQCAPRATLGENHQILPIFLSKGTEMPQVNPFFNVLFASFAQSISHKIDNFTQEAQAGADKDAYQLVLELYNTLFAISETGLSTEDKPMRNQSRSFSYVDAALYIEKLKHLSLEYLHSRFASKPKKKQYNWMYDSDDDGSYDDADNIDEDSELPQNAAEDEKRQSLNAAAEMDSELPRNTARDEKKQSLNAPAELDGELPRNAAKDEKKQSLNAPAEIDRESPLNAAMDEIRQSLKAMAEIDSKLGLNECHDLLARYEAVQAAQASAKADKATYTRVSKLVKANCRNTTNKLVRLYQYPHGFDAYFSRRYKSTYQTQRKDIAPVLAEKSAYLITAFSILTELCALPDSYNDQLKEAIATQWLSKALTPQQRVERYLTRCICEQACARIRGQRSNEDTIKVWYNPRNEQFLLPSDSYIHELFADLSPLPTKRDADNLLENLLKRKNPVRSSTEVRIRKEGRKESVVIIDGARLLPSLRKQPSIALAIDAMATEITPYREPSN